MWFLILQVVMKILQEVIRESCHSSLAFLHVLLSFASERACGIEFLVRKLSIGQAHSDVANTDNNNCTPMQGKIDIVQTYTTTT